MHETLYIIFLVVLSTCSGQALNLSYKLGSKRTVDAISSPPLMSSFAALFIALVYAVMAFCFDGGIAFPNRLSIIFSLALGTCYAVAAYFYLVALACGPYTITAILLNLSSFMPILYSRIFLGETISLWQIIGLAVIISSCIVLTISRSRGTQDRHMNAKWMLFALFMFIANGLLSFFIRANTRLAPETPRNSFFVLAYVFAAAIAFIFFICSGGVKKRISPKPLILPAACVAASLATQLTPTAILPNYLPSALHYPIDKGSAIVLGVIIGIVFFKEKIGKAGWICIAAIIGAMCLLGIG
ncbi:MAG: EamA family transporter [Oscillospiraceae bacterium]|nr:EamA family transporter [Oscillospiraceae bacterium]